MHGCRNQKGKGIQYSWPKHKNTLYQDVHPGKVWIQKIPPTMRPHDLASTYLKNFGWVVCHLDELDFREFVRHFLYLVYYTHCRLFCNNRRHTSEEHSAKMMFLSHHCIRIISFWWSCSWLSFGGGVCSETEWKMRNVEIRIRKHEARKYILQFFYL